MKGVRCVKNCREQLWEAIDKDDVPKASLIIQHMYEHGQINCVDNVDRTSLMYACKYENPIYAQMLLDTGADTNKTDMWGDTHFMYAISKDRYKIIEMLTKTGVCTCIISKIKYGQLLIKAIL